MTPRHKRFFPAGGMAKSVLLLALIVVAGMRAPIHATGLVSGSPTPSAPSAVRTLLVTPDQVISGVVPDLPPGYMVVEGDIQIPITEFHLWYRQSQDEATAQSPEGTWDINLWRPNGGVPYEFDANVAPTNQIAMQQAMQQWQSAANIQFRQCNNNSCGGDYIHIQSSATSNNSAIGRRGGQQIINIVNWGSTFIMAHELGHALGLYHEQNRTDRDSFIDSVPKSVGGL